MKWYIAGTALAVVISAYITVPISYHIAIQRVLKDSRVQFANKTLLIPFIGTTLMVLLVSFFTKEDASLMQFALEVLGGAAFYLVLAYGLDRVLKCGLRDNLRSIVGGFR